jgi:hypothetical protein
MRSLSTAGSPEYSSLIFNNIPSGTSPSHFPSDHIHTPLGGSIIPPMRPVSNTLPLQLQQFPQITPTQLFSTPQINHQNDAIMRAIQNVLSTPPSQQNLLYGVHPESSAFGRYRNDRSPNIGSNFRRQSLMKRSFSFFRNLNLMRLRDRSTQAARPSSNQLHHMISERRRREKLNENFQALRALLPQGTKVHTQMIISSYMLFYNICIFMYTKILFHHESKTSRFLMSLQLRLHRI